MIRLLIFGLLKNKVGFSNTVTRSCFSPAVCHKPQISGMIGVRITLPRRRNDSGLSFGADEYVAAIWLLDYFAAVRIRPDLRQSARRMSRPIPGRSRRIERRLSTGRRESISISVTVTITIAICVVSRIIDRWLGRLNGFVSGLGFRLFGGGPLGL